MESLRRRARLLRRRALDSLTMAQFDVHRNGAHRHDSLRRACSQRPSSRRGLSSMIPETCWQRTSLSSIECVRGVLQPSPRWPPSASAAFRRIKLDEHLPESQTAAYLKSFHTHGVLLTSSRRLRLTQAEKLSAYRLLMGISVHLGSSRIVHSGRRSHSNHESAMSSATIWEPQPPRSELLIATIMFLPMH
jgi:hypothetical protein